MAIKIGWSTQHNDVLQSHFPSDWNWEELWALKAAGDALLDTVNWPCGMLMVLSDTIRIPPGALTTGMQMLEHLHPRVKHIVLVSDSVLVRNLARLTLGLCPGLSASMTVVGSVEQATTLLRSLGCYSRPLPELAAVASAGAAGDTSRYARS